MIIQLITDKTTKNATKFIENLIGFTVIIVNKILGL
jgi:hypothetical protein